MESAMPHQYKAGDVVTVFQISPANELVIEGRATIRTRVAEVDEYYRVEFTNKPGVTVQRFVDMSAVFSSTRRSDLSEQTFPTLGDVLPKCSILGIDRMPRQF
jgi:hypothetical protein